MEYPLSLPLLYLPMDLSTLIDRLTGPQVDNYGITIISCSPILTSGPVNPGRQVDRSTSMKYL